MLNYGIKVSPTEALREHAIGGTYKTAEEGEKFIQAFSKEFAKRGEKGAILGEIKRKMHIEMIKAMQQTCFSP